MAQKGKQRQKVELESSPKWKKIKVQDSNFSVFEGNAVQDMGEHQQRLCMVLLQKLMRHKHGWVFNEPVDADKLELRDYHLIIKNPMDLGTVKKRLLSKGYALPVDFAADVRLTFSNALLYNPKTDDVHGMALTLRTLFEDLWQGLAEKLAIVGEDAVNCDNSLNAANADVAVGKVATESQPVKRLRIKFSSNLQDSNKPVRELTFSEKEWLVDTLEKSPDDVQIGVAHIIKKCYPVVDGDEVDVMHLDNATLWRVYNVLRDHHGLSSDSTSAHELASESNANEMKSKDATCDSTSETCRELVEKKSNSSASLRETGSESTGSSSTPSDSRPRSRSRSPSGSNLASSSDSSSTSEESSATSSNPSS